jgi:hypothetical protein
MSFSIVVHNNASSEGILTSYAPNTKDVQSKAPVPAGTAYCVYTDLAEVDLDMVFNNGETGRFPVKEHAFASLEVVRQGESYIFKPLPQ